MIGGYTLVRKPEELDGLILKTLPRDFVFKFEKQQELIKWYNCM
jgi:hypothetical protein